MIRRNHIRSLVPAGNGAALGIHSDISTTCITHNQIVGPGMNKAGQLSIRCTGGESFAYDNIASGFAYTWTSGNTSGSTGSIICNLAGGANIDKT